MKSPAVLLFFVTSFFLHPGQAQTWRIGEIPLSEDISDGLIEDLNRDGRKDLLLIAGNFIYLFFQREGGFPKNPDQRIFYKLLGEYIDVGEVDPLSAGMELLGISDEGVRLFHYDGSHYIERPGFLISIKVDMPKYRLGPFVSDFAFDINSDGRDEILLLKENRILIFHFGNSGKYFPLPDDSAERLSGSSLKSCLQTLVGSRAGERKNPFFLFRPSIQEENSVLFQDFNSDGRLDLVSRTSYLQQPEFRFLQTDSFLAPNWAMIDRGRFKFFLDIDGDGSLDLVLLEFKDVLTENINIFPFVKVFVHRQKNGALPQTPDFFQKTILVNDQSPFVDIDGDGDLDFVSVWPEIALGSKEDIIQALLDSTWKFVFRCYFFDQNNGYSLTPNIHLRIKIKQDISLFLRETPFDISGDFDGNGSLDLMIMRDPESIYIYFFDLKVKKNILSVKRLAIPGGMEGHQTVDLDGDGRSDILIFTNKGVKSCFSSGE